MSTIMILNMSSSKWVACSRALITCEIYKQRFVWESSSKEVSSCFQAFIKSEQWVMFAGKLFLILLKEFRRHVWLIFLHIHYYYTLLYYIYLDLIKSSHIPDTIDSTGGIFLVRRAYENNALTCTRLSWEFYI